MAMMTMMMVTVRIRPRD